MTADFLPVSAMDFQVEWGVKIPLRDGVTLDATIMRPTDGRPAPVIFRLTPYTADRFFDGGVAFAKAGYAFACVDVRGRGNSGGDFVLWTGEGRDGHDAVEWLAAQPWCDGQVAMWGGSYSGKNQWMIAGETPRGLAAIAPACSGVVATNIGMHNCNIVLCRDHTWLVYMRGKTANLNAFIDPHYWPAVCAEASRGLVPFRDFDTLAGLPSPVWQEWMRHPHIDDFWDSGSMALDRYAAITLPVLAITGQYDSSQTGTIAFRQHHLDTASAEVAARSYLIVGPWDHGGTGAPKRHLGGLDFGDAAVLDVVALHIAWYDHVMKSAPLPAFLTDQVMYFITGANIWRAAPTLAAATAWTETLFLSSPDETAPTIATPGALLPAAPVQPADAYVYDPSLPAHNEGFEGGTLVAPHYLTSDAMMRRIDGDGLIYDTPPLETARDLVGMPTVALQLAMDVPDTDIRVALFEVTPSENVVFLTQDLMRARHRTSRRTETLVVPGEIALYRFERFNFIARRLAAGSRLRLVIVPLGAGFHAQRNRNSGRPVALETAADNRVAHVTVMLGPDGSSLTLPWGEEA